MPHQPGSSFEGFYDAAFRRLVGQLFLVTAVAKVVNVWSPKGWREKVHPPGMGSTAEDQTTVNAKLPATEE